MDIERLSRFRSAMRERASALWAATMTHLADGRRWSTRRKQLIVGCLLLYLGLLCVRWVWSAYTSKPELFTPFFTPIAALMAGLVALGQLRVARSRHEEQTRADFRRRINETYSKAISQLASDKLEERLGGIYTLENISKESPDDYWTVMETLTAFVRERSQRNHAEFKKSDECISPIAHALWEKKGRPEGKDEEIWAEAIQRGEPPATDIAAVLTVIKRRSEQSREREAANGWCFDLSQAVLKSAQLRHAHLERANLRGAHLDGAFLVDAHLDEAFLTDAHLDGAFLGDAHLDGAFLWEAHLDGAKLQDAHLERATLEYAHLEEANLWNAHGDATTRLPDGVDRPAHWPLEEEDGGPKAAA